MLRLRLLLMVLPSEVPSSISEPLAHEYEALYEALALSQLSIGSLLSGSWYDEVNCCWYSSGVPRFRRLLPTESFHTL